MAKALKRFRVVSKGTVTTEYFVAAESESQVGDLLCGEGPPELVAAANEAEIQSEILDDDSEIVLIEEVAP